MMTAKLAAQAAIVKQVLKANDEEDPEVKPL